MTGNQGDFISGINIVLKAMVEGNLEEAERLLLETSGIKPMEAEADSLIQNLSALISQLKEASAFAKSLSEGKLTFEGPGHFYLFSEYKQLQSNLRHLTWQAKQIAKGDYSQQVSFMGEFSVAFNQMIIGLREAKKTQEQLKALYATRDMFYSIISHDLRSPFFAILGFSDMLDNEWDEIAEEERKTYLSNIRKTAHSTFDLLERLLEWSRLQTGSMKFNSSYIDIGQLVRDNFSLLAASAEQKNISLRSEISDDTLAWADKDGILLVLRNLINNAIKFTLGGGVITITALPVERMLKVTVADNGVGIPAGNIKKLFSPDEQYRTEGTHNEKGSGLGLILCREIIEKHRGQIWVESIENEGSRFIFTIPLVNQ